MDNSDDNENGMPVERGDNEKRKIKKQILKNQKYKIGAFFQEFRGYCKNSTTHQREELFQLYHELEKTLTQADKEYLIKLWKPVSAPIILVSSVSQIQEIRDHLNTLDLSRASFDKQHPQQQMPQQIFEPSIMVNRPYEPGVYQQSYANEISNIPEFGLFHLSGQNPTMPNNYEGPETYSCVTRSVADEHHYSKASISSDSLLADLQQFTEMLETDSNDSSEMIISSINGMTVYSDDLTNNLCLIKTLFNQLVGVINDGGDVTGLLQTIKDTRGKEVYEKVLLYCEEKEPILFQVALNSDKYKSVLNRLIREDHVSLNQRDKLNTSLFSFLLIKGIETLFQFLKYAKEMKLQNEVYRICSADACFRNLLEQRKRESIDQPIMLRKRLESVETFCTKQNC